MCYWKAGSLPSIIQRHAQVEGSIGPPHPPHPPTHLSPQSPQSPPHNNQKERAEEEEEQLAEEVAHKLAGMRVAGAGAGAAGGGNGDAEAAAAAAAGGAPGALTEMQLSSMIYNDHKEMMLRGAPKPQDQFKFWSTQPVLRLGAYVCASVRGSGFG